MEVGRRILSWLNMEVRKSASISLKCVLSIITLATLHVATHKFLLLLGFEVWLLEANTLGMIIVYGRNVG